MARVRLPNNWEPRPHQLPVWEYLEGGGKRALTVWHRRAGKDDVALNWAAVDAVQNPATYWHMLPEYESIRKALWNAVNPHTGIRRIDQAFPPDIRTATRDDEMFIKLEGGATWQALGSDRYNSLMGAGPRGVVFSEWSLADPAAWDYIRPMLVESKGWAIFPYTPRGKNHGLSMLNLAKSDPSWFWQVLTVEDTGLLSAADLKAELRELQNLHGEEEGEAIFRQEYYCSFESPLSGAYYGRIMEKHSAQQTLVPYDNTMPVHTAWDLAGGHSDAADSMAVWFIQDDGFKFRAIDYYEMTGQGFPHFAKVLQEKGYVYGQHIGPHDLNVGEVGTGKRRIDVARELGIRFTVAEKVGRADGINAVRSILPRMYFDKDKCKRGISALMNYRKKWDENLKDFRATPFHDWSSHAADAMRYFAVGYKPGGRTARVKLETPDFS